MKRFSFDVTLAVILLTFFLLAFVFSPSELALSPKSSLQKNTNFLPNLDKNNLGENNLGGLRGAPSNCQNGVYVCNVENLLPESFNGCFGDVDGNGFVNAGDRGFINANIGLEENDLICQFDVDGNGFINAGDRGYVAANIGRCEPLPDYQSGTGLNDGAVDTRFAPCSVSGFCGDGTTQPDLGEQCDDGNNVNGDGCGSLCLNENVECASVSQHTVFINDALAQQSLDVSEESQISLRISAAESLQVYWRIRKIGDEGLVCLKDEPHVFDSRQLNYRFSIPGQWYVEAAISNACANSEVQRIIVNVNPPSELVPEISTFTQSGNYARCPEDSRWETFDSAQNSFELGEKVKLSSASSEGEIQEVSWVQNNEEFSDSLETVLTFQQSGSSLITLRLSDLHSELHESNLPVNVDNGLRFWDSPLSGGAPAFLPTGKFSQDGDDLWLVSSLNKIVYIDLSNPSNVPTKITMPGTFQTVTNILAKNGKVYIPLEDSIKIYTANPQGFVQQGSILLPDSFIAEKLAYLPGYIYILATNSQDKRLFVYQEDSASPPIVYESLLENIPEGSFLNIDNVEEMISLPGFNKIIFLSRVTTGSEETGQLSVADATNPGAIHLQGYLQSQNVELSFTDKIIASNNDLIVVYSQSNLLAFKITGDLGLEAIKLLSQMSVEGSFFIGHGTLDDENRHLYVTNSQEMVRKYNFENPLRPYLQQQIAYPLEQQQPGGLVFWSSESSEALYRIVPTYVVHSFSLH